MRWHHRFTHEGAGNPRMAAMIALGEELAACSGADAAAVTGVEGPPPSEASLFLGLTDAQLADLHRRAQGLHIDPHFFS